MEPLRATNRMVRIATQAVATLSCVTILSTMTGCGGGGTSSSPSTAQHISLTLLSPKSTNNATTTTAASIGLTVTQMLSLSATTADGSRVHWSVSPTTGNGKFSSATTNNGANTTFTAPHIAGVYTITATSNSNSAQQATIQVGVTDLAGVFTYHNDNARDGANTQEYALTPANINSTTFGKLFSCKADGAIYAQPLWAANITVNGSKRNVVFVATEHDGLFAFDADANPCAQLWSINLIDTAHGAAPGETTIPAGSTNYLVTGGDTFLSPEIGVTGTPVIDPAKNTLYVVSQSVLKDLNGDNLFYSRVHAIDMATGQEKTGSPASIQGTYPGSAEGTSTVAFNPATHLQRTGLTLVNGTVYISWSSYADITPYYGWLMGYRYENNEFHQTAIFNTAPNKGSAGIWMGGAAPAADSNNNLYLITGNGIFTASDTDAPNNDFGDSLIKLSLPTYTSNTPQTLTVSQYFTPSDQYTFGVAMDGDFGSGGAAVLANLSTGGSIVHLIIGGGKDGNLYLLNSNNLGGYGDSHAWQRIQTGYSIFSTIAFWNQAIYLIPNGGAATSYTIDTSSAPNRFIENAAGTSTAGTFGYPGSTPSISANGFTNGILWALDNTLFCIHGYATNGCGPTVLHAFDANSLTELWNSSQSTTGSDTAGYAVKFTVPTIANGKVYIGTRGNDTGTENTSASTPGELDVYGLK